MRFRRWPRVSAYEDTPRKRAALARAQLSVRRPVRTQHHAQPFCANDGTRCSLISLRSEVLGGAGRRDPTFGYASFDCLRFGQELNTRS